MLFVRSYVAFVYILLFRSFFIGRCCLHCKLQALHVYALKIIAFNNVSQVIVRMSGKYVEIVEPDGSIVLLEAPIKLEDIKTEEPEYITEADYNVNNDGPPNKKPEIKIKSEPEEAVETKEGFKCDTCGKVFTLSNNLKTHIKIHTGEKNYTCEYCDRQFSRSDHLKTHLRIHLGIRNHVCMVCDKTFQRAEQLKVHIKNIHLNLRQFQCDICTKQFKTKFDLKNHISMHTGVRRFTCHNCKKGFVTKSLLRRHVKIHSGERPYDCEECGKDFIELPQLKSHMRTHVKKERKSRGKLRKIEIKEEPTE